MTALIYKAALPTYTSAEALAANADENLVLNDAGTAYELEPGQSGASVAPLAVAYRADISALATGAGVAPHIVLLDNKGGDGVIAQAMPNPYRDPQTPSEVDSIQILQDGWYSVSLFGSIGGGGVTSALLKLGVDTRGTQGFPARDGAGAVYTGYGYFDATASVKWYAGAGTLFTMYYEIVGSNGTADGQIDVHIVQDMAT